ncbi:MAG: hypothetical protein AAF764_03695 [Pseudomonadota bacterium]
MFQRITASAALIAAALTLTACNEADTTQNSADPSAPPVTTDQTITNSTEPARETEQPVDGTQAN